MLYLDYNATAPYGPSVRKYLQNDFDKDWANPSGSNEQGRILYDNIRSVRASIADFLDCSTRQIIFTSGATESINTVLSSETLKKNNITSIITNSMEHSATLKKVQFLAKQGLRIKFVENSNHGLFSFEHLEKICRANHHSLISLLFANNETGVINDVKGVLKIAKKYDCMVHIDAVQALGKIEHSLEELDVDFASYSGHKIGSLKGIGLLYCKDPKSISPLIIGGEQEKGLRAGTYNYSAIKSLELAILDINFEKNKNMEKIRDKIELNFLESSNDFSINAQDAPRLPNTSNIYLGEVSADAVVAHLSRKKIYLSAGSACSSGTMNPSHVIMGLGHSSQRASSSIRISLGTDIEEDICDYLVKTIAEVIWNSREP